MANFNINNLAQKTNFIAGSNTLKIAPIFVTTVSIPAMTLSHPEIGGRFGSKLHISSDYATFNQISLECLIDEDFRILSEILKNIRDNYSPKNGTFTNNSFDFWLQLNNSKGNPILRFDFENVRITSFGEINLTTQDDTNSGTFSIDLMYDYYDLVEFENVDEKERFNKFFGVK